ncbi:MAG: hypothetical protein ACO1OB_02420 [Archangium sp.]
MSPGAKLTVFLVLAGVAFIALRWLLHRLVGRPKPSIEAVPKLNQYARQDAPNRPLK